MRCGCPECGAYMTHRESKDACVCPECGSECRVCLGALGVKNAVVKREDGSVKVPEEIIKRYDER
jgi:hypothetical protein